MIRPFRYPSVVLAFIILASSWSIAAVCAAISITHPVYVVEAELWIQRMQPIEGKSQSLVVMGEPGIVSTACEIITSAALLKRALTKLSKTNPDQRLPSAEELATMISALQVKDSDVLSVRLSTKDARTAPLILQAVIDEFVRTTTDLTINASGESRPMLEKRLEMAQHSLDLLNASVAQAKAKGGFVEGLLEEQHPTFDVKSEIARAKLQATEAKTKVDFLQKKLGLSGDQAFMLHKLAHDDQLIVLRKKQSDAQDALNDLRSRYTPKHPNVKSATMAEEQAQKDVDSRIQALIGHSGIPISAKDLPPALPDPPFDNLIAQYMTANSESQAYEAGHKALQDFPPLSEGKSTSLAIDDAELKELVHARNLAEAQVTDAKRNLEAVETIAGHNEMSPNVGQLGMKGNPHIDFLKTETVPGLIGVLGTIAALLAAQCAEYLDPTLRSPAQAPLMVGLPVIGWVKRDGKDDLHIPAPDIERLRASLKGLFKSHGAAGPHKVILTSAEPGIYKTAIAASLASSFVRSGMKVVLIETDAGQPAIHQIFPNIDPKPGLTNFLKSPDQYPPSAVLKEVTTSLKVVPAGEQSQVPLSVDSPVAQDFFKQLQGMADVIIFSASPTTVSPEALTLAENCHLLVVVRPGMTSKQSLQVLAGQLVNHDLVSANIVLYDVNETDYRDSLQTQPKRLVAIGEVSTELATRPSGPGATVVAQRIGTTQAQSTEAS